ncbi:indolepyruvate ferredoxin oxidoreductase family protein [Geodermatophilus marinus]|uniref:indolepyruvate ferredoxin oxidoreductase family protein n=1 Tax=Geodermatophilus sp. LHW52908 TaxID=2303986 RepID=UPI000E3B5F9A|nr:indolepyruvate ferredoxin oxidoreductase family protein [Geodermatophilus sp. LHW52908]RFU21968.1 indolepyruvate ferredoxin oxidoreductase family protein [Geodermatophilus sp. LHW52908]
MVLHEASPLSLDDKFTVEDGTIYLTGVQALVRLPLVQRRADLARGLDTATFISGYPGSPLGGYDLELQRRRALLAEHHVVHTMGVNEELAATSVMGSQLAQQLPDPRYDGVVGMWYGKANGFDRAMDALRQANLCGTTRTGGALALVGDDPTAKSSPTPGASEVAAAALMMPMLYPGDVQEVLDLGLHAIAMSRCSGLWTALKMSTPVADGSGSALVSPDRVDPVMVAAELDGRPYEHVPSSHLYGESVLQLERSMVYARIEAALAYARANDINRITVRTPGDRLGLVASGKTYFELRQALRELGLDDGELRRLGVRLLQLRMPYPLDGRVVREFASGLEEVLVLEDKRPFVELFLKDELYGLTDRPQVFGKLDERGAHLVPIHAELDTRSIARLVAGRLRRFAEVPAVEERLERLAGGPQLAPLALSRSPYFCSGCPHNSSAAAVPEGAVVGGGTGCHVLAVFMRPEDVGSIIGITAMGNEGAQWIGAAPFTGLPHLIQNIGDGTYAHSGTLAIRASIAAGTNITYKLLYNDHVAMTGAQPAIGIQAVPQLVQELLAEGVKRVVVTTEDLDRYAGVRLPAGVEVWDRDRMVEAQELLRGIEGVTVIVHDQECAAEKRRKRKRGKLEDPALRVLINERVCEGCGDCGVQSNCLSVHPVETEFGRKTQIHQPSCNKDYSCLKGNCPSFLTVVPGKQGPRRSAVAELDGTELPEPELRVPTDEFGMRITGIGGTGVVTVAQTLATAALLDGRFVRGLDQTGLAQKGGPVVSDLRITTAPVDQANKLTAADCDLYLACDLLVGAQQGNLAVTDRARTIAVVSTAQVPTGQMVVDTRTTFPDPGVLFRRIERAARPDAAVGLDAQAVAERLFGGDQAANILLVGAAYQSGALPLSADSIEQAIELNGVAVATNLQAFRRGRQAVSDPEGLEAALTPATGAGTPQPVRSRTARRLAALVRSEPGSPLEHLVDVRVADLVGYQDAAYAERYARAVERVRAAEADRVPGHSELAEAAASGLHKLMAYKDEYEVARLHLDDALATDLRARFGPDARFGFMLHPPTLKALGMQRKITVPGRAGLAAFRALAGMKRLRGTRLDPFGRDHVRVVERGLVREYEQLLEEIADRLTPADHELAVELARLPDVVRGYDEIKLRNVEIYHEQMDRLRARLTDGRLRGGSLPVVG